MADPKGVDPFEAFKAKKKQAAQQSAEEVKNAEAAKKLGWIEGVGPAGAKPDAGKPKGFSRGRFEKPPVSEQELAKIKPKKFEDTKFAKPTLDTKPEEDLPPEEKRRPGKFTKF
jgi:hypothetical protein